MKNLKRIPMEHLYNLRDLGGYACEGGKSVRYHRLYRCEGPDRLTAAEWRFLTEELGIRTVIDLRSDGERAYASYTAPAEVAQIGYSLQNVEVPGKDPRELTPEELKEMASQGFGKSLADGYMNMLEKGPERVAHVLTLVAEGLRKGAVLYHCTAGKDRTGVLSALIYLLCGVADVDIIADYQVSATCLSASPMFQNIPEGMRDLMGSAPENMVRFLANYHQKDYLSLLKQHGLTEETISAIRSAMTE